MHHYHNDYKLSSCSRITIATITGRSGGMTTSKTLTYSFKYKGHEFSGSDGEGLKDYKSFMEFNINEKKRYFVKFACDDLDVSKLIWNIPVPDTLKNIPLNGWDKIPL
ncbi:hypothetical protein GCM10011514_53010 [Emticicia aquatilis]|uniref:Uncharacterized protein n=1 Tax=Emticicia aquatilis TaxID=1537369 RepID=A0A916Z9T7_9BACT|nr:hypothetical protein GCM10011514_53010 [Emticicia aquatilis]